MPTLSATSSTNQTRALTGSTLFLLAGLAALGALATNIILPAFPHMGADLGVSTQDLALTLSSFFIAFAFGQLLVGPLSDRFGRQWLVLGGLATFAVGSLLCALADSLSFMIAGRVVQALGACAAVVLSRAIARDLFDGAALARALALVMIAMSAAPGFSPLVGGTIHSLFGWQIIFIMLALFAAVLALHYWSGIRETNPPANRTALTATAVASAYGRLAINPRFILPALTVSLVIGGLYTFFAAAPAVLMNGLGFSALGLGVFFAATVFIVMGAGLLAPRLARRWGQYRTGLLGICIALTGGLALFNFAATPSLLTLTIAIVLYLFGMGLINPLGTAIALQPFGQQAGLASALLGFLQMSCAAIGTTLAAALPVAPALGLAIVLFAATALALVLFIPVGRNRSL